MKLTFNDFLCHYNSFVETVKSKGPSYPPDYQKINSKTELLIDKLQLFDGASLVDIGSNFGMLSLLASMHAMTVIGVERDLRSYNAAISAKQIFCDMGFELSNVEFVNDTVRCLGKLHFNAVLLSLVLYHLSDVEVAFVREQISARARLAIVQCRPGRGVLFAAGKLPDYASAHSQYNGLYAVDDNIHFLSDCGFADMEVFYPAPKYNGEDYPIIVASK